MPDLPEINAKRVEILKEAFPPLRRVAILFNPNNPGTEPVLQEMKPAAASLMVDLQQFEAGKPGDFDDVFSAMAKEAVDGLRIVEDPMFYASAGVIGRIGAEV